MKLKLFLFFSFVLIQNQTYSQQTVAAAGGNAVSGNGSVSYSVGQIGYVTSIGSNGSVAQGVQQPFEISTVLGIEETNINLAFVAYPNPTAAVLTLKILNYNIDKLSYTLFDLNGRSLQVGKITADETLISMAHLPEASYFLHVFDADKNLKTFQIIKK